MTSPPVICRDTVIVGSSISDGPQYKGAPRGDVQAFDVRIRQAGLDLSRHSAGRGIRQRHLGRRIVEVHRQCQRVDVDDHRRRARLRLLAHEHAHQ